MRTRNHSNEERQSTGKEMVAPADDSGFLESLDDGNLADISHKAVGKLLNRVYSRGSSGSKKQDNYRQRCDLECKPASEPGNLHHSNHDDEEELDESFWEDGSSRTFSSVQDQKNSLFNGMTIEFDGTPDSAKRKTIRRASAEDKELAELVHKVHLLCLLGRGRLIDDACNDPLIQASLLSLLPTHLTRISEDTKLTVNALVLLVNWFNNNFRIRSSGSTERSFHSALAFALETQEGTSEEVAALSVALFRALNLTTRFVSILDVASLKPDTHKSESVSQEPRQAGRGLFQSSTLMVAKPDQVAISPVKQSLSGDKGNIYETSLRDACWASPAKLSQNDFSDGSLAGKSDRSKRKGDLEFEMQLEMALSASAAETSRNSICFNANEIHSNSSNLSSPAKRLKTIKMVESPSSSQGVSTAFGSRKVGAPLYWAEIYCSGENLTGKWVHVDAVNAVIDGEHKVEPAVAACRTSLRYAVAFAGHGAKDVTRRYCMKWYKIASERVDPIWWGNVLAPLTVLESGATGSVIHVGRDCSDGHEKVGPFKNTDPSSRNCTVSYSASSIGKVATEVQKEPRNNICGNSSAANSFIASRSSLEDMELETRALTEPIPTNQQAYKNHHLYALERWLTKYQILHPKGPVLGYCSGLPVYPRTSVQLLHTKERWLREGLQIKANELPVKVMKRSQKPSKGQAFEADDDAEGACEGNTVLYGKWQTEPLCLPHAVNGIVPRNERGQVDVWSEKCLPPGTVHLRLPRLVPVAKRLEIDFAPAMVGFDFRNGRSIPVFEGIVVCAEFQNAILEAYAEEEERREAEEKKRNEVQAISRWYQLLSSIVTRQRLKNCYGDHLTSHTSNNSENTKEEVIEGVGGSEDKGKSHESEKQTLPSKSEVVSMVTTEEHEHVFLTDDRDVDEQSFMRTKRCHCGFSIQVEEFERL